MNHLPDGTDSPWLLSDIVIAVIGVVAIALLFIFPEAPRA